MVRGGSPSFLGHSQSQNQSLDESYWFKLAGDVNIAPLFFGAVFGNDLAGRVMQGAIALCVFSNLIAIAFIASRGKQKILPSMFLINSMCSQAGYCQNGRYAMVVVLGNRSHLANSSAEKPYGCFRSSLPLFRGSHTSYCILCLNLTLLVCDSHCNGLLHG
jgi:hypothetical protein